MEVLARNLENILSVKINNILKQKHKDQAASIEKLLGEVKGIVKGAVNNDDPAKAEEVKSIMSFDPERVESRIGRDNATK